MQRIENQNSRQYLEMLKQRALEHLRQLQGAPSVQMQEIPPDLWAANDDDEANPDVRESTKSKDQHVEVDNEFYDDDNDQDGGELDLEV